MNGQTALLRVRQMAEAAAQRVRFRLIPVVGQLDHRVALLVAVADKSERELAGRIVALADQVHAELRVVDAASEFLDALMGVIDPQEKRRRIGHVFIDVSVNPAEFRACPVNPEVGGDGGVL